MAASATRASRSASASRRARPRTRGRPRVGGAHDRAHQADGQGAVAARAGRRAGGQGRARRRGHQGARPLRPGRARSTTRPSPTPGSDRRQASRGLSEARPDARAAPQGRRRRRDRRVPGPGRCRDGAGGRSGPGRPQAPVHPRPRAGPAHPATGRACWPARAMDQASPPGSCATRWRRRTCPAYPLMTRWRTGWETSDGSDSLRRLVPTHRARRMTTRHDTRRHARRSSTSLGESIERPRAVGHPLRTDSSR